MARAVIAGAVVAAALGTGAAVALDGRDPAARAEDPNASAADAQSPPPSLSPSASPSPQDPALLLPNMRSLKPTDLQIQVVGNERRLRFAASLANFGPGPLLVLPQGRSTCPRGQHPAVQVLHRDANSDSAFQLKGDKADLRRDVGCKLHHPGHKHWHYDAMARYSLRLPSSDKALVARNKVSFWLRDNRRVSVPGQAQVARNSVGARVAARDKESRPVGPTCTRRTSTGNGFGSPEVWMATCSVWIWRPTRAGS